MRNISAWAIRNPIPPIVLFMVLTLLGIVSFFRMDVNAMPDVAFPAVQVTINQPGAAPVELETQVTQKVDAALASIGNVKDITSWDTEGQAQSLVQFQLGTPVDRAVNDVRDAVAKIRSDLPEGILEPIVQRWDIDGTPIVYFSVSSTDMTLEQLSWYVDNTVIKRLLTIKGVAQIVRGGGVNREIRVILDPVRMQSQGITAAQVNTQLRALNINAAGGRAEVAGAEQSVRVLGNAANAVALGATQIAVGNGRTVRLSDIADVKDLYAEQRSLGLMNGRQVTSFGITKAKGSSDVTVFNETKKVIAELEKENPKVHFQQLFTTVNYTEQQYHSAIEAMIEGAVLAVLVVFLFLRDWRSTIISALAIPLSAVPTFWIMDLLGFTLNTISLLALSLVAGILVDDAIVEIENIVRHMRMGKTAFRAAMDAADEIGLAVVATTMSIVAVFLPVSFMTGISGQFFKQFGLTVAFAVLMSLGVARLITPLVAAYFLQAQGRASHGEGAWMDWYMRVLEWSLRNRWKTVIAGASSLAQTHLCFAYLPQQFQPTVNRDDSMVNIELAPGARLEDTRRVADQAAAILNQAPEVATVYEQVGAEDDIRTGTLYITL